MVSQILRMVSQIQAGPAGGRKEYLPPGGGGKGYCSPPAGGGTEGVRTGGRTPSPPTIVPPLLPGGVRREYQGRPHARSRGGAARPWAARRGAGVASLPGRPPRRGRACSGRRLCRIADPCRVAARPSECRCACHDSARTAVGGACRERPVGPGRSGGRTRAAATQLKPSEDSRRSRSPDLGARQRVGGVGPSAARWSRSISSALERCRRLAARQNAAPGGPARPVSGDGGQQEALAWGID